MLQKWKKPVPSLLTLCLDYILEHLYQYSKDGDSLCYLPLKIKDRLLKKLSINSFFWKGIDFKKTFSCLIHDRIDIIDLTSIYVDDELLQYLEICKNLQKIYLSSIGTHNITTKGLMSFLKCVPHLQFLQIRRCDIVDDIVLECISENCHEMVALDVGGCTNITDSGLSCLQQLKGIRYLTLSRTQITNVGLIKFIEGPHGPILKELKIDNCRNISAAGLLAITKHCPTLEILVFYNCGSLEDDTMINLEACYMKNLKQLTWTVSW